MESNKKIALGLMGIVITILIILNFYQHQQIKELTQDAGFTGNAISGTDNAKGINSSGWKSLTGDGKESPDDLNYHLDVAEEELDMANKQLADEAARKAELRKKEIELKKKDLENLINDPITIKNHRDRYKMAFEMRYASLIKELNLSPEKLEKLRELLVDGEMASMPIDLEMWNTTPSEEKRAEFKTRLDALENENEEKLSEFLGENDYEKYKGYKERLSVKTRIESFDNSLGSDERLTADQQQKLIDDLHERREKTLSEYITDEDRLLFPLEGYKEEEIERSLNNQRHIDESYIEAAEETLSPIQLEKFKTYLKKRRDKYESTMKSNADTYGTSITQ